ncbi:MAG: NAD(P)H-hydrate dehydratase [Propionibacteriaceae bacterium]|nr:NAD(P)H-hydrate dehydratase [Propionibacteriaceae bacterium]
MAEVATFSFLQVASAWPTFDQTGDKYARGVVGVMTGSRRYPGAAVLSVLGALNAGAGFVRYCGVDDARSAILTRAPSVTFGPGRVGAWVAGCGWDDEDRSTSIAQWRQVCADGVPVVIDAGALALAADGAPAGSLMTPHAGELARLMGVGRDEVESHPVDLVRQAARLFDTTVLLKGHTQLVCAPGGQVTQLQEGSSWPARAGSGDVLAGIAGTLLAQGVGPDMAGLLAAGIQAMVSLDHPGPYPPDRIAEFLPHHIGTGMAA